MYSVLRHREPQAGESRTVRFEGRNYGGGVSFFLVDNEPGQGPGLHVHPYSETWIVRTGEAEFTVGDEKSGVIRETYSSDPPVFRIVSRMSGQDGWKSPASMPATRSNRNLSEAKGGRIRRAEPTAFEDDQGGSDGRPKGYGGHGSNSGVNS